MIGPFSDVWAPITWEAGATLFTGMAAVLAAWKVGRLQAAIARDQVAIADRQLSLQIALRNDALFERRMLAFDRLKALHAVFDFYSGQPNTSAEVAEMLKLGEEFTFLFPSTLCKEVAAFIEKDVASHVAHQAIFDLTGKTPEQRSADFVNFHKARDVATIAWGELHKAITSAMSLEMVR